MNVDSHQIIYWRDLAFTNTNLSYLQLLKF